MPQAENMEQVFRELGLQLDAVIALEVEPEELISRITSRRTCKACGSITNLNDKALLDSAVCPRCGGELFQREDDNEGVVRRRNDAYRRQSEPLIEHYRKKGVLYSIDARGTVPEVTGRIEGIFNRVRETRQQASG
ncbi:MAG: nucleoside monophosphate kinase [Candidatus Sumerlaeaceae bacterium]|nr:nucleoside monophosphate kinase [Candidatus Sumerlaeaceae bacterium]